MSSPQTIEDLDESDWNRLQDVVERFEEDCLTKIPRNLGDYLPPSGDSIYRLLLEELVRTDLEIRWRAGFEVHIEEYLKKFPILASPVHVQKLLEDEFRVRHQFGDGPEVDEFGRRFPDVFPAFRKAIDELVVEDAEKEASESHETARTNPTGGVASPPRPLTLPPPRHSHLPPGAANVGEDSIDRHTDADSALATPRPDALASTGNQLFHFGPKPDEDEQVERWSKSAAAGSRDTVLFHPRKRVEQPILVVFNDDGMPGDQIILRKTEFRIGREIGDLVIPHDLLVSARHAMLRWNNRELTLSDEGSRNGTFWRLRLGSQWSLRDGDRFLCGRQIFQFSQSIRTPAERPRLLEAEASLVRVGDTSGSSGQVWLSRESSCMIGRDPQCEIPFPSDNFLSSRHARVCYSMISRSFMLEDQRSLNGVYVKLTRPIHLANGDMFRVGEQLVGILVPPRKTN